MPSMRLIHAAVKPAFRHEQTDRHTDRLQFLYIYIYIYIYIYGRQAGRHLDIHTYRLICLYAISHTTLCLFVCLSVCLSLSLSMTGKQTDSQRYIHTDRCLCDFQSVCERDSQSVRQSVCLSVCISIS